MNRWKWLVIVLIGLSLAMIAVNSLGVMPGWRPDLFPRRNPQEFQAVQAIPLLDQHMRLISSISILLSLAMVGTLILFVIPGRIRRVMEYIPAKAGRLLRLTLFGLLVAVVVLVAGLLSVLAIGTFPLTIFLLGIMFAGGLIGFIALAYWIGRALIRRAGWQQLTPLYSYWLGLLVLFAISQVPWIGPVFFLLLISLGLGAAIGSHFGSGQPWNLNPLLEDNKNE